MSNWLFLGVIIGILYFFIKRQTKVQQMQSIQRSDKENTPRLRIQEITDTDKNTKRLQLRGEFLRKLKEMEDATQEHSDKSDQSS